MVAIPELLVVSQGGSLFGIFESQGGRATPRDPPNSTYDYYYISMYLCLGASIGTKDWQCRIGTSDELCFGYS